MNQIKTFVTAICVVTGLSVSSAYAWSSKIDAVEVVRCHANIFDFAFAVREKVLSDIAEDSSLSRARVRVRVVRLFTPWKYRKTADAISGFDIATDTNSLEVKVTGEGNASVINEACKVSVNVTVIISVAKNDDGRSVTEQRTTSRVEVPGIFK